MNLTVMQNFFSENRDSDSRNDFKVLSKQKKCCDTWHACVSKSFVKHQTIDDPYYMMFGLISCISYNVNFIKRCNFYKRRSWLLK